MTRCTILVAALALAAAAPAAAQVQNRPAREGATGVFGGGQAAPPAPSTTRSQQTLALTVSMLGSHDDRSRAEQRPGTAPALEPLSARSAGLLDANLRYRVGTVRHWFQAYGSAFMTAHDAERPLAGGEGRLNALTTLGRRTRLDLSQTLRDAPFMTLAGFGDLAQTADPGVLPDSDPTLAVNRQRSRTMNSAAVVSRDWTSRQSTSVGYNYSRTDYAAGSLGFDGRAHSVNLSHTWQFSRTAGLQAAYNTSRSRYAQGAGPQPTAQSATVGLDYARRLSPTRQIAFAVNGGASHVETIGADSTLRGRWTPSGSGSVRVDVGRSWAVTTDYSRSATVLDQAALRTFYSDAIAVNTGGLIGRRLDATLTASFARGRTPGGTGEVGRYESVTGSAQLRWALTRSVAAMVGYTYHDYRLRGIEVLEGFPVRSRLNGVRVGLSFWVPLVQPRPAITRQPTGRRQQAPGNRQ